jgi:hypothetical protein
MSCSALTSLSDLDKGSTAGPGGGKAGAGVGGSTGSSGGKGDTGGGGAAGNTGSGGEGGRGSPYRDAVLQDHPVAYYRLDEARGPVAMDLGQNGYNGTYLGGVALGASGALSNDANAAADFDGVDDWLRIGDVLSFPGTAPFSVEAWLHYSGSTEYRSIIGKFEGTRPSGLPSDGWHLYLHYTGGLIFQRYSGGLVDIVNGPELPVGVWTHVAATFDGFTMLVYFNGREVGSGAAVQRLIETATDLQIGHFFVGSMDEVAIYDKALSPMRLAAHMAAATSR